VNSGISPLRSSANNLCATIHLQLSGSLLPIIITSSSTENVKVMDRSTTYRSLQMKINYFRQTSNCNYFEKTKEKEVQKVKKETKKKKCRKLTSTFYLT